MFNFAITEDAHMQAISQAYRLDETKAVQMLANELYFDDAARARIKHRATTLIEKVRISRTKSSGVDALMHEFSLSSEEGVALMCLAEALLRIPDNATRDALIEDKLKDGDWERHLNNSPSLFVNAASYGLMLTGKITKTPNHDGLAAALSRVIKKGGAPAIRGGVNYAMKMLGKQFVTGQTIDEAIKNGKAREKLGYRFSYDMLGEAAMSAEDAERYYQDYVNAIHAIGKDNDNRGVIDGNGISVKLSAIHPRYERAKRGRVLEELLPKLKALFMLAKEYNIGLNIDAEEARRLQLSLELIKGIISDKDLQGFDGIGVVVQAYQKRCPFVIEYLAHLAKKHQKRIMVRLVKGAYWDSEIKWAQVDGMDGYPVYTQKVHTDVSYLACAKRLLAHQDVIYPQFATHNAQTLASVIEMAGTAQYEFQCLHGMGEALYDQVVGDERRVRIYAPVGTHKTLLAYLVRRLLENGANSSFVNQIVDENIAIDALAISPVEQLAHTHALPNVRIPHPLALYPERKNSQGIDLSSEITLQKLQDVLNQAAQIELSVHSLTASNLSDGTPMMQVSPNDRHSLVGYAHFAHASDMPKVLDDALNARTKWQAMGVQTRAGMLNRFADLLQERSELLIFVAVHEAGKTMANAINEIREAVDFCRYYANEAIQQNLNSPLGTVVAISPWNFPLAIFVGQVVASLVVGNTVVAKPAEQTSIMAWLAVSWLHEAGVPVDVLQLVLGAGDVGSALIDSRIHGVVFTGSTEVAKKINQTLALRDDNPVLIAETGGMNAMIVDSSALFEQVCADVLSSAFDSAGQRCSALRILCVQEDIADGLIHMIKGAMDELSVAKSSHLSCDVGPVIDTDAKSSLLKHINHLKSMVPYHEVKLHDECKDGTFIAPILFELPSLDALSQEIFGPVLHIVRYKASKLDSVIDAINAKGYGLTHGIHTRIDERVEYIQGRICAGNVYVNRNIVGAVVGVQPFGGHGLSGTGPKAGGPFYLHRLSSGTHYSAPDGKYAHNIGKHSLSSAPQAVLANFAPSAGDIRFDTALAGAQYLLAGPTGEENVLSFGAPQTVYLFGGNQDAHAAAYALLSIGTRIEVNAHSVLAPLADGDWVRVLDIASTQADALIMLENMPSEQKLALAHSDGKIVRLYSHFAINALLIEQSTSINTTAAGGNATLMAS